MKIYTIDKASLPPKCPTDQHSPAFWESLGRAVATFGFLERTLKQAIFALTGTTPAPEEEAVREGALEEWGDTLQKVLVMTLSPLVDQFQKAAKVHPDAKKGHAAELAELLRKAARIRNVLCHGAWDPPDASGASRAFYFTGKGDQQVAFDTLVTIAWIDQVQVHTLELACEVVNSVQLAGYQFPGASGPGRPLRSSG